MPDFDSLWTNLISDVGQTWIALAIVGLAAVYLVWKLCWPASTAGGCDGCQQCPRSDRGLLGEPLSEPLIELKPPPANHKQSIDVQPGR
jgi:hypothetical protein